MAKLLQWDSSRVKSERHKPHGLWIVVTLYITTRQTAMNAFSSFYWTTGLCVLDMTQWWNEQSKANPRNSHAGSWCIQIQGTPSKAVRRHTVYQRRRWMSGSLSSWKSDSCLQFQLCTMPSNVSGTHAAATLLNRTFHQPPTCNTNNITKNAPTLKVMTLPGPS